MRSQVSVRTRRTEIALTVAVTLVGVHTLADAFFAAEPGTHWDDHFVAGTASLAVLAAVAWAVWRARDGVRAPLAFALGLLALEGAALEIADARAAGELRGDDWTGLLLAPAGITLCAVAVLWLWKSRRRTGRRYLRRALLAIPAVVGVYWLVVPIGVALLATHRPRESAAAVDLERAARIIVVRTNDGLDLHARYVPSRNRAAVIVFPGNASRARQARMLVRHGYGVLMLDMRGYGASDGDPNMFGWGATKDIDAGIRFLRSRPDVDDASVGGLGFSVGGELMLEAAAHNHALRAVVADGAGERSVRESVLRGPSGWLALPSYAVQTIAVGLLSGDPPPSSLADLTPRIAPTPMFLIGAGRDNGGEDMQPHYFAAAREPKLYWKIPEAGHTGGFEARPGEYTVRVVSFFDRSLHPKAPSAS
jgi:hypothetical protein